MEDTWVVRHQSGSSSQIGSILIRFYLIIIHNIFSYILYIYHNKVIFSHSYFEISHNEHVVLIISNREIANVITF